MQNLRAFQSGIIAWLLIFLSFTIMSFLPLIQDSTNLQNGIIALLIIPFILIAAKFYYKKQSELNGLALGFFIIITCLSLDALITVPFVIIPKGGSYADFFTDPGLFILAGEIFTISFLYWKLKIRQGKAILS